MISACASHGRQFWNAMWSRNWRPEIAPQSNKGVDVKSASWFDVGHFDIFVRNGFWIRTPICRIWQVYASNTETANTENNQD